MNIIYGYIQTKILEGTVYYGYKICKNMAYDFIFNGNKNNQTIITDPVWNKELQRKVFKKVVIETEDSDEENIVTTHDIVKKKKEESKKEESDEEEEEDIKKKTKEIEIQTGESLAHFSAD